MNVNKISYFAAAPWIVSRVSKAVERITDILVASVDEGNNSTALLTLVGVMRGIKSLSEYFPLPGNSSECYQSYDRMSYNGTVNVDFYDRPCLFWKGSGYGSWRFPDESVGEARNYCRNPSKRKRPWCHVRIWRGTKRHAIKRPRCDIPLCDGEDMTARNTTNATMSGANSKTIAGKCKWHEYWKDLPAHK